MRMIAALAAAATLLAGASGACASGLLGPPEPPGREDARSVGIGVFLDMTTWKPGNGNFSEVDVSRTQIWLQGLDAAFGFGESGAAFLRIGGADFDDGANFKDGFKPFGTVGFKNIWYEKRRHSFKLGTIAAFSFYSGHEDEQTFVPGSPVKVEVGPRWEVSLGVAAQQQVGRVVTVYGGPLFLYGRGTVDRTAGGVTESTTFEERDIAGLFGGARVKLGRKVSVEAEGQYRGAFSGGLSLAYLFD